MTGTYGSTSGTDSRDARPAMPGLLTFGLDDEIADLRSEDPYTAGDRNSRTLAKEVDFRVLLSVLRPGAQLDEQDGDARASIHLLRGSAIATAEGSEQPLDVGQLLVVDAGRPWTLRAESECAVLLTFAWPREKAGV